MMWPNVALQKGETLKRKRTQIFSAGTQKAARTAAQIGLCGRPFLVWAAPFGRWCVCRVPVRLLRPVGQLGAGVPVKRQFAPMRRRSR